MKAIILNSGTGTRMGSITQNNPKCLTFMTERETILSNQLNLLLANKVDDIIITTGPFEQKIRDYIKLNFPHLRIEYIHNPRYDSTNYIYSLYLVRDFIDDDIILMHGDMVFEEKVFKKLISSGRGDYVLVNDKIDLPKKDFKGKIKDDRVCKIGVDFFGSDCFFLAPIYKFSQKSFLLWLKEIEEFVKKGETGVYAENAFNNISDLINLRAVYFDAQFCMEIDTPEDVKVAKEWFSRNSYPI